jgi:CheY-like chemotaxis protein
MAKKILLADDSLTIQKVVELTFSDSDYELVCVSNGQKALDRIREDRPDLVLADVVMPEKNGYEVCEAIKSNPATARIPVLLLSGTFEPFDRERAERIGADAIVSKPFDSQQLIAQVEALLDRFPARSPAATIAKVSAASGGTESSAQEEAPFDVGFSADDFTASVRRPPRGTDPFEEEYVRGDVESAIEAFEKSRPLHGAREDAMPAPPEEASPRSAEEDAAREPLAQWLRDEPERAAGAAAHEAQAAGIPEVDVGSTVAIPMPLDLPDAAGNDAPTAEIPMESLEMNRPVFEALGAAATTEASTREHEQEGHVDSDRATPPLPGEPVHAPAKAYAPGPAGEAAPAAEIAREIELLAQRSSIPELTQMLSSVARASGNDMTDEQIESLARRVVEKLSDRIVREIAWEVIPDMAEIVIKRRIKELEAGIE